jgi:hypothetical protein
MESGAFNTAGTPEVIKPPPLDAVVVCGMGPVGLKRHKLIHDEGITGKWNTQEQAQSGNPVAENLYNFFNAEAAKLLAGSDLAKQVILSGFQSAAGKDGKTTTEQEMSEAGLLEATYKRAQLQSLNPEQRVLADSRTLLDEEARTTFGNIINGLNLLDKQAGGYFDGSFAVLSAEFHGPRLQEMIKAFGLGKSRVIAAERVMKHFGYKMQDLPKKKFFQELESSTYNGQAVGLQNLQENPSYVTFELGAVQSDRRFWEMASSVIRYYKETRATIPPEISIVYNLIPDRFDPGADWSGIKNKFSELKSRYKKNTYHGDVYDYRPVAKQSADQTDAFLQEYYPKTQSTLTDVSFDKM